MSEWQPTGWWRVIAQDGSLWCESSDEQENRERTRPGDTLWRHEQCVEQRWVEIIPAATDLAEYVNAIANLRAHSEKPQRDAYTVALGQLYAVSLIDYATWREALDRPLVQS